MRPEGDAGKIDGFRFARSRRGGGLTIHADDLLQYFVEGDDIDRAGDALRGAGETVILGAGVILAAHDKDRDAALAADFEDHTDAVAIRLAQVENDDIRLAFAQQIEEPAFERHRFRLAVAVTILSTGYGEIVSRHYDGCRCWHLSGFASFILDDNKR